MGNAPRSLNKAVEMSPIHSLGHPPQSQTSQCVSAVLPKMAIQANRYANVGANNHTQSKIPLIVRPLEIRATNNPTKGAQANHQPQ